MTSISADGVKKYFMSTSTVAKWWDTGENLFSVMFPQQEKEIVAMLPKLQGKKVIDLGCGKGRLLPLLTRPEAEIYACDISKEMITISKNKHMPIPHILCDAENLPFRDEAFDGLLCIDSLTHFPDTDKAIDEIGRVTKIGGFIVISYGGFTFYVCWHDALTKVLNWRLKRKSLKSGHWTPPTKYMYILRQKGFKLQETRGIGIIPCLSCIYFHIPPLELYPLFLRSEKIFRRTIFKYVSTWIMQKWKKIVR